jgi:serine kinase of HPr protein (carbohydrate metabolism regulator)
VPGRHRLQGSAFGVGFSVQADTKELLAQARLRMPPTWRPGVSGTPRRSYTLAHAGDGVLVEGAGLPAVRGLSHRGALDVLESDLQLFVAQHSRAFVFVHAGVVAIRGCAFVFPGTSGAGKTTLVRALLEAGATYYSDEYALFDASGRVHPYARALSVREGGGKVRIPVRRGLAPTGRRAIPVGVVVQTEYSAKSKWRPRRLTRGEVVLALLSHTVPARERPAEVLATLATAARNASGVAGLRGSAASLARVLLSWAEEKPR